MKVKNLGVGPVSMFVGGISMACAPGDHIESDNYTEAEVKFYRNYPAQFEIEGEVSGNVFDPNHARDAATLQAIVDLFGTPDVDRLNVKAAVERIMQDLAAKPGETSEGASDLASAIALLDDANDDHWTQAGLPDISTLKALTGGDVTRAMVDQLPDGDKRVRKV